MALVITRTAGSEAEAFGTSVVLLPVSLSETGTHPGSVTVHNPAIAPGMVCTGVHVVEGQLYDDLTVDIDNNQQSAKLTYTATAPVILDLLLCGAEWNDDETPRSMTTTRDGVKVDTAPVVQVR